MIFIKNENKFSNIFDILSILERLIPNLII